MIATNGDDALKGRVPMMGRDRIYRISPLQGFDLF
jgi:hypothetical protein